MKKSLEKQIGGDHYKSFAIQPMEFVVRNNIPYREGCVIKYVTRHASKNGAEDIKKAIHILEMILEDYATSEECSEDRTVKESLQVDGEKTIQTPDPLIPLKKLEALRVLYPDHEWIAMDECEEAYLFQVESPSNNKGVWNNEYVHMSVPTLDGYATDWKTSLIHIPTEIERIKGLEAEV